MDEIRRAKNVILFIDELHTIVGAGSAEGAMDASNIIKPALSRGELQCIGATTLNEYRKYIEKDAALERRFQTREGRGADRRRDHPDPQGPSPEVRGAPQGEVHRRGPRGRRQALRPLHHRPLPAGQGHRRDGRGRRPRPHRLDDPPARRQGDRGRDRGDPRRQRRPPSRRRISRRPPPCATTRSSPKDKLETILDRVARAARGEGSRSSTEDDMHARRRRSGPASRSAAWSRRRPKSSSRWRTNCKGKVIGQDEAVRRHQQGAAPLPRRPQGSAPPDRLVHVPRPDRRRQDLPRPHARRIHVRRRRRAHPDRHVRVHGEVHRLAA